MSLATRRFAQPAHRDAFVHADQRPDRPRAVQRDRHPEDTRLVRGDHHRHGHARSRRHGPGDVGAACGVDGRGDRSPWVPDEVALGERDGRARPVGAGGHDRGGGVDVPGRSFGHGVRAPGEHHDAGVAGPDDDLDRPPLSGGRGDGRLGRHPARLHPDHAHGQPPVAPVGDHRAAARVDPHADERLGIDAGVGDRANRREAPARGPPRDLDLVGAVADDVVPGRDRRAVLVHGELRPPADRARSADLPHRPERRQPASPIR